MKRFILLGFPPLALVALSINAMPASASLPLTANPTLRQGLLIAQATPSVPPRAIRETAILPTVGMVFVNEIQFGPAPPPTASPEAPESRRSRRREAPAPPPVAGQVSFQVSIDQATFYRWFRQAIAPEEAARLKPQTITLLYYDIDGNLVGQTSLMETVPVSEQRSEDGQFSTFTFNYAQFTSQ